MFMPTRAAQSDCVSALAMSLRQSALASRQRRALLLSGSASWCRARAVGIAAQLAQAQTLWLNAETHARKYLGGEKDLLIYDAHDGFDADAFGAVSGVIRGGGLMVLLTPPLTQWPELRDPEAERFFAGDGGASRFIRRFIAIARQAHGVVIVNEGDELAPATVATVPPVSAAASTEPFGSADQAEAVAAIIKVARGHRRRPAVLIADRGRGKSSALGIAAAQLLQQGIKHITVTGPRLDAVAPVFEHAHRLLPEGKATRGLFETDTGRLVFMPPDELIAHGPETELLLVDEAAAIPTPMLSELLSRYARIAFATTVHGYEGTGRGFSLRFNKVLDRCTPGWQQVRLHQAIRWADNDPLESFVFNALLLDAVIADETQLGALAPEDCRVERIHRDQLLRDEQLLSQTFGLLVLAHYRTRPNDLRQLLDSPGLQVYVLRHAQHVVAVALLLQEGDLDAALAKQIYLGRRRPSGHLLPQSLAFHAGLLDAPQLRYLRLMRIAVHPALQGRGLGTHLVNEIITGLAHQDYDCVGTSFGLSTELLGFWQRLGFVPARLGLTREHSSGCHSLIMLRPLSPKGTRISAQAHGHMQAQLPDLLSDPLRDFDAELARRLMQACKPVDAELDASDWQDIFSFAYGNRGYESCMTALFKALVPAATDPAFMARLDAQQRALLIGKVMQKRSWPEAVKQSGVSGRAAALQALRHIAQLSVARDCPQALRESIRQSLDL